MSNLTNYTWETGGNTRSLLNATEEEAIAAGVPQGIVETERQKAQSLVARNEVRLTIAKSVADIPSLLGTVSDATGLLIAFALADVVALSSSTDFAKYKKAKLDTLKALAGDADLAALAGSALAQIQSGDAVLTASLKGLDTVISESLTRSTAVATILKQAAKTSKS